jgi:integrase
MAMEQAGQPIGMAKRSKPGSVSAAIAAYLDNPLHFASRYEPSTRQMQRAILECFREQYGELPIAKMPAEFIAALLAKKKPHAARNWRKTLTALCAFAKATGLIKANPMSEIVLPKMKASDGWHTWTADEVAKYETRHPIGSKARLAFALGAYTGQRRGDVIRMGRQHLTVTEQGRRAIFVRQQKTGAEVEIELHPALAEIIDATPGNHLTFLITKTGKPYAANDFSEQFRVWCKEAGLPDRCVFHGLRKWLLTRIGNAGGSTLEIAAISGHKTLKEIDRYTRARDQKRLGSSAMARIISDAAPAVEAVAKAASKNKTG